jgi:acetyl-CoA carboxylase biotin carboxyl carrier protein
MQKKSKLLAGLGTEARGVDLAEVERLLAFMQKHGLEEFEYQRRGVHIRLKKTAPKPGGEPGPSPAAEAAAPAIAARGGVPAPAGTQEPAAPAEELHLIKSPIVGTFYAAPSPDADPFVTVGTRVERGQVLCIIEAMKLMNEIESDVAGEVVRVLVENGNPVEYGEALFGIRPAGKS